MFRYIGFPLLFLFFFHGKKSTHADKKNWPIKNPHMFLILEMFLFNCPWGTERERERDHMTKGAVWCCVARRESSAVKRAAIN